MSRKRVVLLAVIGVLVTAAAPAAADASVDRQTWRPTTPVSTFTAKPQRIYVAVSGGTEEARAFVHIRTAGTSEDDLSRSALNLFEADDGSSTATATLFACALAGPVPDAGQPAPAVDCTLRAPGVRDVNGSWSVSLAVFASRWTTGQNYGLALLGDTSSSTLPTWRVSFDVTRTAVASPATSATPPTTTGSRPSDSSDNPVLAGTPPAETAPVDGLGLSPGTDSGAGLPSVTLTPSVDAPIRSAAASSNAAASADTPSFALVFAILAALGILGGIGMARSPRLRRRIEVPVGVSSVKGQATALALVAGAFALLPLAGSELTIFRAGTVLIFIVAAAGLHILVNWAGQLSLAHAGMVGLPAFTALAISETHGISPIYLLPLAMLVGAILGAVVALPTLKAKGLQVAILTLVAGIAIDRFFFTKPWLVGGQQGRRAATPTLGPLEFSDSRSLYPVLLGIVFVGAAALWCLMHSKMARAWYWIKADPDAAAAFGVPVAAYRIYAYVTAGTVAGLAGGLSVMWVQQLSAGAFPTRLSFGYLLPVVLAGNGYLGALVVFAALSEGGRAFHWFPPSIIDYLGPIALVINITKYPNGLNGGGRQMVTRMRTFLTREQVEGDPRDAEPISLAVLAGGGLAVTGLLAIALAWYHVGNTDQTWIQNQEIVSGGLGGLALVLVGSGLLVRDRLSAIHRALTQRPAPEMRQASAPAASAPDASESDASESDAAAIAASDAVTPTKTVARRRAATPKKKGPVRPRSSAGSRAARK